LQGHVEINVHYIFIYAVGQKFEFGTNFTLVLESDGSQIDDDDVLTAVIMEGHILTILTGSQMWQPCTGENSPRQV
jgi:hypothetical protein